MEHEFTTIQKGCGAVYACQNMLYRRVKTRGSVKYLKCAHENCDGSAKIVDDKLILMVRTMLLYQAIANLRMAAVRLVGCIGRILLAKCYQSHCITVGLARP